MSTSKKCKLSGLSRLELVNTLTQIRKLRSSLAESDPAPADTLADQLDALVAMLKSQVTDPLSLSPPVVDGTTPERFNIVRAGMLFPHRASELSKIITASRTLGSNQLWSNDTMYKHLSFLGGSLGLQNETSSRMIIDTFFFRATAMVPPPRKVVVMVESQIPVIQPRPSQMDTISGFIDYTAIVAEASLAEEYIRFPPKINHRYRNQMIAFFAAEAKASTRVLLFEDYLPQVLLELVACAKHLGESHIRGALTTGFLWYFIVVDINADNDGAKYWVSSLIEWKWKAGRRTSDSGVRVGINVIEQTSDEFDPAFIAGVLSSWIPESFTEFTGDQWFTKGFEGV